jgi:chitin disaccharide deacetylase
MGLLKRLIVNADGFGFGPGATQGVMDALKDGKFISSVSVNANFPEVSRLRELVVAFPQVSIGVHLNPIVGRPCLSVHRVPSLVDRNGCFHGERFSRLLRQGAISYEELKAELATQIRIVKDLVGDRLTHLDSQENLHLLYFDLFLRLAREAGLHRMRNNASLICLEAAQPKVSRLKAYALKPQVWLMHCYRRYQMQKARAAGLRLADNLITVGYAGMGNKTHLENWLRILRNLPVGTYEIYCHPAYPDNTIRQWSYYCDDRAKELAVLRREELYEAACRSGVEIINFDAI